MVSHVPAMAFVESIFLQHCRCPLSNPLERGQPAIRAHMSGDIPVWVTTSKLKGQGATFREGGQHVFDSVRHHYVKRTFVSQ